MTAGDTTSGPRRVRRVALVLALCTAALAAFAAPSFAAVPGAPSLAGTASAVPLPAPARQAADSAVAGVDPTVRNATQTALEPTRSVVRAATSSPPTTPKPAPVEPVAKVVDGAAAAASRGANDLAGGQHPNGLPAAPAEPSSSASAGHSSPVSATPGADALGGDALGPSPADRPKRLGATPAGAPVRSAPQRAGTTAGHGAGEPAGRSGQSLLPAERTGRPAVHASQPSAPDRPSAPAGHGDPFAGQSLAGGTASTGFVLLGGFALLAALICLAAPRLHRPLRLPGSSWASPALVAALERPG